MVTHCTQLWHDAIIVDETVQVQEIGETILIPRVGENNADQPEKISDSGANQNKASLNKALIQYVSSVTIVNENENSKFYYS